MVLRFINPSGRFNNLSGQINKSSGRFDIDVFYVKSMAVLCFRLLSDSGLPKLLNGIIYVKHLEVDSPSRQHKYPVSKHPATTNLSGRINKSSERFKIICPDNLLIRPDDLIICADGLINCPDGLINRSTMSARGLRR